MINNDEKILNEEILIKNPKYKSCILNELVKTKEDFKVVLNATVYQNSKPIRKSFICAETYEECLEILFIQKETWRYCNDIDIKFDNVEDSKSYNKYFFEDKEGIGRYASMGGNMY